MPDPEILCAKIDRALEETRARGYRPTCVTITREGRRVLRRHGPIAGYSLNLMGFGPPDDRYAGVPLAVVTGDQYYSYYVAVAGDKPFGVASPSGGNTDG